MCGLNTKQQIDRTLHNAVGPYEYSAAADRTLHNAIGPFSAAVAGRTTPHHAYLSLTPLLSSCSSLG